MPNVLGMTFAQCVSRFSGEASISDPEAFCGSLEKLIGLGKAMTLSKAQMAVVCPPCAEDMGKLGIGQLSVGGDRPIPVELSKRLHRLGQSFHVTLPVVKRGDGLVTGWAAVVTREDGSPIIDFQGDILSVGELEKAVQRAMARSSGAGKAGDMHEITGMADVVESMVVSAEKREALGFGKGPEGWVVTLRITDPDLLKQIESGEKPELSIRGRAKRVPVEGTNDDIAVLQDLDLSQVELLSVVDAGASGDANHRPAIVLVKRGSKVAKKTKTGLLERLLKLFTADPTPAQIKALEAAIAKQDDDDEEGKTLEAVLAEMDEESKSVIMAALTAAAKQEEEEEEEETEEEEEVEAMKNLPEHVRKKLERVASLEKRVDEMTDANELAKCVAEARTMPNLTGASAEEIGKLLHAAKSLPKSEREALEKLLKSADAVAAKSALFAEYGTKRPAGADTAEGELNTIAEGLLETDEAIKKIAATVGPRQAMAKARSQAANQNPELYSRARAEAN